MSKNILTLILNWCLYLTSFSTIIYWQAVTPAYAQDDMPRVVCPNGILSDQIEQLQKIGLSQGKINSICQDKTLGPQDIRKLRDLTFPHQVPSPQQINNCVNAVSGIFNQFQNLINAGFNLGNTSISFKQQCEEMPSPPPNCPAQAAALAAQAAVWAGMGIVFRANVPPVVNQCRNALTNGNANVQFPESMVRRLFENNDAKSILSMDLKSAYDNWKSSGQLPPGFNPYFPEEEALLKELGLNDDDLRFLPPRDFAEVAEDNVARQLNETLDEAPGIMRGLAITVLLMIGWGVAAPFYLIACATMPSILLYVASSIAFLGVELAQIAKYKRIADQIKNKLMPAVKGLQSFQEVTPDQVEELIKTGKAIGEDGKALGQDVVALFGVCQKLVGQVPAAGTQLQNDIRPCRPGGGNNPTSGEVQVCLDDAQATTNATLPAIQNCINRTQAAGIDAATLANKGLAYLDEVKAFAQRVTNQIVPLRLMRDSLRNVRDVLDSRSKNALAYSILLATSSGVAIGETAALGGACFASSEGCKEEEKDERMVSSPLDFIGDALVSRVNAK